VPPDAVQIAGDARGGLHLSGVLFIAGMYAARRYWIDFELSFACRIGKPRIRIVKWGAIKIPRAPLPSLFIVYVRRR
jgi:hypothetical protein